MRRVLALAAVGVAAVLFAGCGDTPISEQSCAELADTEHDLEANLAPGASFDDQSDATADAADLNDRVNELGGCPGEPTLQ